MKLTEKQKNGFYIALSMFLAVGFVIIVFFIVRHFKNTNCITKCNGKNCGTNGCGGICGNCTSSQTCGKDGICTSTCVSTCGTKNCGSDNCGVADKCGTCTSSQTCDSNGKCRNKLFVAVGAGPSYLSQYKYTIITSPDGITWSGIDNSGSLFYKATKVKFNGTIWVVIGEGVNSISYSKDNGITWLGIAESSLLMRPSSLDCNRTQWVVTGVSRDLSRPLVVSSDGISWTSISTASLPDINSDRNQGQFICWFKNNWILVYQNISIIDDQLNDIYVMYCSDNKITESSSWSNLSTMMNYDLTVMTITANDDKFVIGGNAKDNKMVVIYKNDINTPWIIKPNIGNNVLTNLTITNIQYIQYKETTNYDNRWYANVDQDSNPNKNIIYYWYDESGDSMTKDMQALAIPIPNTIPNPNLDLEIGFGCLVFGNKKLVVSNTYLNTTDQFNFINYVDTITGGEWTPIDMTNRIGILDIFYG